MQKSVLVDTLLNKDDYSNQSMLIELGCAKVLSGRFKALIEENGKTTCPFEDHNMIVDVARKALTHLLAEGDDNYKIASIALGTKGHDLVNNDILSPVAPQISDTALIDSAPFSKAISSYLYQGQLPDDTSVIFQITMEKEEGNGTGVVAYTEAGLMCTNSSLFARETFPAVVKNANRRITFQWVIQF